MFTTNPLTIYSWMLLLFTASLILLSGYAFRRRNNPVSQYFALLLLSAAFYSGGYAFEIASQTIKQAEFWISVEFVGLAYLPSFMLLMVYGYHYHKFCSFSLTFLLLLLSTITLVVQLGNSYHHLSFTINQLLPIDGLSITQVTFGAWYYFHMAYVHLSALITMGIFYRVLRTEDRTYKGQAICVITGVAFPWTGYFLFVLNLIPNGLDPTPFLFIVSIPLFMFGFFRFHLLDLVPIGREQVFDSLDEAVIILNHENRLVDFNAEANRLFPSLDSLAIGHNPFNKIKELQPIIDKDGNHEQFIEFNNRYFEVSFGKLKRKDDIQMGCALILRDITERQKLLTQLKHHAEIDGLTGMLNRRIILSTLDKQIYMASINLSELSVILFDLDFFKQLNDSEGHQAGDEKLKCLAQLIKREIRSEDYVGRYGGDEFLIILPKSDVSLALAVSERLNNLCQQQLDMTLSMGVACFTLGDNSSSLIQRADKALYHAKKSGKAQACSLDFPAPFLKSQQFFPQPSIPHV